MAKAPTKIRVAQDADGFWTCREAVSGSQQYVREDLVAELVDALREAETILRRNPDASEPPRYRNARASEVIRKAITKATHS